jgi:hypothetical protein
MGTEQILSANDTPSKIDRDFNELTAALERILAIFEVQRLSAPNEQKRQDCQPSIE